MKLKRETYLEQIRPYYDSDIIKVIVGVRRCGKSILLDTIRDELVEKGIPGDNMIYLNLEDMDYEYIVDASDLNQEIKSRITHEGKYYIFLDEIQHVKNFEKALASFRATLDVSLFVTGSNSTLLSGELATLLTGRTVEFEMSFRKGNRGKDMHGEMKQQENGGREERNIEKSPERLAVIERIHRLEREGRFDVDAEDDPPTLPLMPKDIDYLRIKLMSRIKTGAAYVAANKFLDGLLRDRKLIIKKVYGMENLNHVSSGAVLTCNHFNPFDCFTVEYLFRCSGHRGKKKLFKVIREGNYTNFPGFYGFLFRNCNTLPLSQNKITMYNFLRAVDTILTRGDFILIYPEQSLWWNYRKPKPLKNGAYKFAVKNRVPVIPLFITMEDDDRMGEDGFPVQEYTVFVGEPIYPDEKLGERQRAVTMRDENYRVWKGIYEEFYGIPLTYETEEWERR